MYCCLRTFFVLVHRRDYRRRTMSTEKEAARKRAWAKENPAYQRAYRLAHKEEAAARSRAWAASHPEAAAEKSRDWRLAHPEEMAAFSRAYYRAHKGRADARSRVWAEAHPESRDARNNRRRAHKKNAPVVENVNRSVVFERDKGICGICGLLVDPADWHLDHVVPLSKGGKHSYENTRVTHPRCNLRKGASISVSPLVSQQRKAVLPLVEFQ